MRAAFATPVLTPSIPPHIQKFRLLNGTNAFGDLGPASLCGLIYCRSCFHSSNPKWLVSLCTHGAISCLCDLLSQTLPCLDVLSSNCHLADFSSTFKTQFRYHAQPSTPPLCYLLSNLFVCMLSSHSL